MSTAWGASKLYSENVLSTYAKFAVEILLVMGFMFASRCRGCGWYSVAAVFPRSFNKKCWSQPIICTPFVCVMKHKVHMTELAVWSLVFGVFHYPGIICPSSIPPPVPFWDGRLLPVTGQHMYPIQGLAVWLGSHQGWPACASLLGPLWVTGMHFFKVNSVVIFYLKTFYCFRYYFFLILVCSIEWLNPSLGTFICTQHIS